MATVSAAAIQTKVNTCAPPVIATTRANAELRVTPMRQNMSVRTACRDCSHRPATSRALKTVASDNATTAQNSLRSAPCSAPCT